MMDAHRSLILGGNTFPILFIRFNPHSFTVDDVERKVPAAERHAALLKRIRNTDFSQDFGIEYMYYDVVNGLPAVFKDPDYDATVKGLVTACVY